VPLTVRPAPRKWSMPHLHTARSSSILSSQACACRFQPCHRLAHT
jgi:hypothetical protein